MPRRISTVRGREFGAGVRAAIDATGMTHRRVAELLGWDMAKVSDLINGKLGVTELELAQLLGLCRTSRKEVDHLMKLFRAAKEKGWWQLHDGTMPNQLRTLIEHQDAALQLTFWSATMVPGLLQIADYMRAVMSVWPDIKPSEIEQRVAARLARQDILERSRSFTFYVHEYAIRLPVGGPDVMSAQLHHLLRMSVRPYIDLRIVPELLGAHAGLAGSFHLMKFDKIQPVVHVESENSSLFLEDEASIARYTGILTSLDQMALDAEESRRLITDLAS